MLQRFAVWLFRGWARPALYIVTNLIIIQLMWRHVSQGWAACLGMMSLNVFCFLKVLDRLAHITPEERAKRSAAAQIRRRRIVESWRPLVEARRKQAAKEAVAKARIRVLFSRLGLDDVQRMRFERNLSRMSDAEAAGFADQLEASLEEHPSVVGARSSVIDA